jgi:UDP-3-O-[3-hydroxymyristoyl] glucosamine N-acyltransferase
LYTAWKGQGRPLEQQPEDRMWIAFINRFMISETAIIEEDVSIGNNVLIGEYSIIKSGTIIGDNVAIGSGCIIGKRPSVGRNQLPLLSKGSGHTFIDKDVIINDGVYIYSGTKVDASVYIADKALIREGCIVGKNSVIGTATVISFSSVIGKETKIMSGCNIGANSVIGNKVFIGVHVVTFNDSKPYMTGQKRLNQISAAIDDNSVIGSNATIYPNVKIGKNVRVSAGTTVRKNIIENDTLVVGFFERIIKKL